MTAGRQDAGKSRPNGPHEGPVLVWLPPLLLMAVIWFFSSQSDLDSGLGLADLIGRKIVHAAEYGLLCLLWWRALGTRLSPRPALAGALVLAIGYGAVDEYHQTFTPGRNGSPVDVAIDSAGAMVAAALITRRGRRARRPGPEPERPRATASRAR
ncbi:MAG TPA: VanZ family protein [Thermoleophilaceae bacterium]|nr:VanZ family protein [Thermoleophilaceae bacterium]